MKADRLTQEFSDRRVPTAGGRFLLRAADALVLIDRAAEEGVPILGVDGVRLGAAAGAGGAEHMADFSAVVAAGHGCWQEAEALIRGRDGDAIVFALALGDDPVEAV